MTLAGQETLAGAWPAITAIAAPITLQFERSLLSPSASEHLSNQEKSGTPEEAILPCSVLDKG